MFGRVDGPLYTECGGLAFAMASSKEEAIDVICAAYSIDYPDWRWGTDSVAALRKALEEYAPCHETDSFPVGFAFAG